MSHACHYPAAHHAVEQDLEQNPGALHNTKEILSARAEMLAGKRPTECSYCWNLEDLGEESPRLRQTRNEWSEEKIAHILRDPLSPTHRPTNLEIGFSRACNFACVYCSPEFSSRWVGELQKFGPLPVRDELSEENILREKYAEQENPYVRAFEKWLPELKGSLNRLGITGGEPTLSAHTFRFLEQLNSSPTPNLNLHLNSNLGAPRATIEELVAKLSPLLAGKKIATFKLYTSLESFGPRAEYARYGLDWNAFWENLEFVLKELPEATVGFMSTYNLLSVSTFPEFLRRLLEWRKEFLSPAGKNRITLSPNYLRDPSFLSAQLTPKSLRFRMAEAVNFMRENRNNQPGREGYGFLQSELSRIEAMMKWTELSPTEPKERRRALYLYLNELDRRRGTSFEATFPELRETWEAGKAGL